MLLVIAGPDTREIAEFEQNVVNGSQRGSGMDKHTYFCLLLHIVLSVLSEQCHRSISFYTGLGVAPCFSRVESVNLTVAINFI